MSDKNEKTAEHEVESSSLLEESVARVCDGIKEDMIIENFWPPNGTEAGPVLASLVRRILMETSNDPDQAERNSNQTKIKGESYE